MIKGEGEAERERERERGGGHSARKMMFASELRLADEWRPWVLRHMKKK
jgi:hypothetical protein